MLSQGTLARAEVSAQCTFPNAILIESRYGYRRKTESVYVRYSRGTELIIVAEHEVVNLAAKEGEPAFSSCFAECKEETVSVIVLGDIDLF